MSQGKYLKYLDAVIKEGEKVVNKRSKKVLEKYERVFCNLMFCAIGFKLEQRFEGWPKKSENPKSAAENISLFANSFL